MFGYVDLMAKFKPKVYIISQPYIFNPGMVLSGKDMNKIAYIKTDRSELTIREIEVWGVNF